MAIQQSSDFLTNSNKYFLPYSKASSRLLNEVRCSEWRERARNGSSEGGRTYWEKQLLWTQECSLGTSMKSRGQGWGPTHIRTMSHRDRSTGLYLFLQQLLQSRSREGDANVWIPPGLGFYQTSATEGDEVKKSRTLPRMWLKKEFQCPKKGGKAGKADRHQGRCLASSPQGREGICVLRELRGKAGVKDDGQKLDVIIYLFKIKALLSKHKI